MTIIPTTGSLPMAIAELEIIKGLKIRANYGYDQTTGDGFGFSVATPTQTRGPSISSLNQNFGKSKSFLEEYFLTYNKNFNDMHDVNLTAGYSSQVFSGYVFSASRLVIQIPVQTSEYSIWAIAHLSAMPVPTILSQDCNLTSFVETMPFKGKYLLTATMRADGSSKFAPGKRWGYFPAFSAGWRISDEKFFANVKANKLFKTYRRVGTIG